MKAHFELKSLIQNIGEKTPKFYKSIEGSYLFNSFILFIDYVHEKPNDPTGLFRIKIDQENAQFPKNTFSNRRREIALRDFLSRTFYHAVTEFSSDEFISFEYPGQEIIERTSVFVDSSFVEVRFNVTLRSDQGTPGSDDLEDFLFVQLPQIVDSSLIFGHIDKEALYKHIETSEDADFLRNELENLRLIAFIAEDSMLPRFPENSQLPLNESIPFRSPYNLKMDVELPNKGQISGMGIPRGITYITGDKHQGKSSLLNAIQMGIYNHIPGDGREFVVSNPNSVKVRSEEGRSVNNVDISAFLPALEDANSYSTDFADNITSEAANIIESIEIGADVLLLDEDTSAPGFLFNNQEKFDIHSQEGVSLIPYLNKVKSLFREYMISTILVTEDPKGSYQAADFVIRMKDKKAHDITSEVQEGEESESNGGFGFIHERIPFFEHDTNMKNSDTGSLENIACLPEDYMNLVEQIVSVSQLKSIEKAVEYSMKYMDGKRTLRQVTSLLMLDIGRAGLDILGSNLSGSFTEFRKIELVSVLNRLKSLKVIQK